MPNRAPPEALTNMPESHARCQKSWNINVKQLSTKELRQLLVNASGNTRNQIINELDRRNK